ncbi:MAG: Ig-like domain-containing protein [Limisphaerales bacterium]
MKAYSCLRASLLSTLIIGASPALAQLPTPIGPIPWPPPKAAPTVEIVTPSDGSMFLAPADIQIAALTAYFTDTVASVEFFAGTNSLGVVTNSPKVLAGLGHSLLPEALFWLAWSNVPPGEYALTATATDHAGNMVTSAPVDISVVTNFPPCVVITKPKNDAIILGPTNINISAAAIDRDGTVTQVEFFFEGTNSLGVVTNVPTIYVTNRYGVFPIQNTSFSLTWSNVAPGDYVLTAVATDNGGVTTTSQPVDISVVTHLPPQVKLIAPYNGATYFAPATIGICAATSDPDGTVTNVEFFAGTTSLGVVTNSTAVTNREGIYNEFCFTWSGVAKGAYTLTAVATDNAGATATSAPVSITVLPPPPPSVRITSPGRGEVFIAPANIWICSATRYFPDPVASVQYFSGTNSLGIVTNGPGFCFHWTKVPPGAYTLTATATDVAGTNIVTSPPVSITVKTKSKWWAIEGPAAVKASSQ